jgi:hypothetical protein
MGHINGKGLYRGLQLGHINGMDLQRAADGAYQRKGITVIRRWGITTKWTVHRDAVGAHKWKGLYSELQMGHINGKELQ